MSEKKITNENVTNKDVLEFYADKGTGKLIKKCPTPEIDDDYDNYAALADTFIFPDKNIKEKNRKNQEENKEFYEWLKEQEKQNFSETLSLAKVTEKDESFKDFILNPVLEDPLIEKWHLYVSWYALKEYREKKKTPENKERLNNLFIEGKATNSIGILKSNIACHRLLLWMYEASEPDMESELYKKAEDAVCNGSLTGLISFFKEEIEKKIKKWKESRTEQDN